MKKTFLTLVFFVLSITILYAKEKATVKYVIDGDTIKVIYKGKKESVRFIGIDTPESRRNRRAKKIARKTGQDLETIIALGKRSKKHLKSILKKEDIVYLEFDIQQRDMYGRLLAYVYKGHTMLNIKMVYDGYASPYTVPPCVKYEYQIRKAYNNARKNRRGLWQGQSL